MRKDYEHTQDRGWSSENRIKQIRKDYEETITKKGDGPLKIE